MTKFKKILIIITGSLFLLVITSILLLKNKDVKQKPSPVFPPSITPKITLHPQNELKIISMPALLDQLSVVDPIPIIFNEKIDYGSLEYFIEPEVKVFTEAGKEGSQLIFKPVDYWRPNTEYTLVITGLKSINNAVLIKPLEIKFKALVSYDEPQEAPAERNNPL